MRQSNVQEATNVHLHFYVGFHISPIQTEKNQGEIEKSQQPLGGFQKGPGLFLTNTCGDV